MATTEIKVGDRVWWDHINSSRHGEGGGRETVVTRVGRKYFEVECDRFRKFDLVTRRSADSYRHHWVYTLEEKARREHVAAARKALFAYGLEPSMRMSEEKLLAAYELLKPILPPVAAAEKEAGRI